MATYHPTSSSHQRDVFPDNYIASESYQEISCPPADVIYQNQLSTDTSFLELLSGNMQPNPRVVSQVDHCNNLDDEQKLKYQELSLSLGMQFPYNYLTSNFSNSSDPGSQTNKVENTEYLSFNLVGTLKNEAINSGQNLNSDVYGGSYGIVGRILDPKYLKPSQELLEEVANLHEALSQLKMIRHNNLHKLGVDEKDSKFTTHESTTSSSGELSASEKQDLQNKVTKLFSLLDMVDSKYREYYQQLQIVEAALDVVSGSGAARPYTELARKTISHHFRCLRDSINGQIQLTRQSLGEHDESSDRVLPRLKNVEKQLRQQRNLHHLGGTRHSWRPQRGLPESSVSILRAWLFEHFLNPYPKDSEKLMLAKQTGLTRSQVRLWKPMIEDIYKEEFGDAEGNCISSQTHTYKSLNDNSSSSEDKQMPMIGEPSESNPDFFNQVEVSRFAEPHLSSDFML